MIDVGQILLRIIESLKDHNVEKIILFGSYADGLAGEDSDLDIIVVTSDDFIPQTNHEKMLLYQRYNQLIRKFRKEISIDMIVYTKAVYQKFQESESVFSKEINTKGKVLYEAINAGMA